SATNQRCWRLQACASQRPVATWWHSSETIHGAFDHLQSPQKLGATRFRPACPRSAQSSAVQRRRICQLQTAASPLFVSKARETSMAVLSRHCCAEQQGTTPDLV